MTKRFGSLVGTPKQAARPINIGNGLERYVDHVLVRDTYLAAAVPIADTIQVAILPWETMIDFFRSDWTNDALGAASTISIGDITFPAALCAATATSAAGSTKVGAAVGRGNYFKPLWQVLGYATLAAAKLIGPQCELLMTIAGGAITGNVTWQLSGQPKL